MSVLPTTQADRYVEVAVALPLWGTYTYRLPASWGEVACGQRLLVPFGPRRLTAFVLAVHETLPEGLDERKLKEPIDVLEDETFFDAQLIELIAWVASYYRYPLGGVFAGALPADALIRSKKVYRITELGEEAAARDPDPNIQAGLRLVRESKQGVTLAGLQRKLPGVTATMVRNWERRDWILALEVDHGGRIPREKVYRIDPKNIDASDASLSKKAQQVLSYVMTGGEATVAELQRAYGSVASSIKTLQKRGVLMSATREKEKGPFVPSTVLAGTGGVAVKLNTDQALAVERISQGIDEAVFTPVLLQGVTGSGKTEVYIRLAEEALARGKSVLVLVPEISLTPQLVARFASRLPVQIAVLHSGLAAQARFDMFRKAARGEARVVIGARSAVFAPLRDVGLIVVDEEHEPSYKQEESPRYHARDTALMRGKLSGCPVVLGSATPSVESRFNSDRGRYSRYFLPRRATAQQLATVELVDLKAVPTVDTYGYVSQPLYDHLARTLAHKHQAILFLNRRGYAPYVLCGDCGESVDCPDCSVSLVYHRTKDRLHCHYCGFDGAMPAACAHCGGVRLRLMGLGTQRVEESLIELFPEARVERMDRDSVSRRGSHEELLERLSKGELDILVGTQMLTKGLDFPAITLVGVLQADAGLHMPDFRAAERAFQTLVQVAGRAGRGEKEGRVVFQSYRPENPVLKAALGQDYERFYGEELERRRAHGFPPFMRLVRVLVTSPDEREVIEVCDRLENLILPMTDAGLRVLGPSPAPLERIKRQYRWHLLLQSTQASALAKACAAIEEAALETKTLRVMVDVDPASML